MDIDARAFGKLEGDVQSLGRILEDQNATLAQQNEVLKALTAQVGELRTTLSEARGGWKTLMWLGGAAAAVGGFVTWALNHISFNP